APAHRRLAVERALPAGFAPALDPLFLRFGRDHAVALLGCEARRAAAAGSDDYRRRLIREGEHARVLNGEVLASRRAHSAAPPLAYGIDRFGEHGVAHVGGRPRLARHVLVELLAGAEAEGEAAAAQQRDRRRSLRDDRRMIAYDRTGDGGHELGLL